jgi:ketosteroid isomerase-like protein
MADSKIEAVEKIYAAFGTGDVPTILDMLTDDVDWSSEAENPVAPWHGRKNGKAEVPSFFSGIAEAIDVTEFTPLTIAANDTDVLVVIRFGATGKASGKSGTQNIHHWWRFRDDKVCYYRGSEDTALTAEILRS